MLQTIHVLDDFSNLCGKDGSTVRAAVLAELKDTGNNAPKVSSGDIECKGVEIVANVETLAARGGYSFVFIHAPNYYYIYAKNAAEILKNANIMYIIYDGTKPDRTIRAAKLAVDLWLDISQHGGTQGKLETRFWEGMTTK